MEIQGFADVSRAFGALSGVVAEGMFPERDNTDPNDPLNAAVAGLFAELAHFGTVNGCMDTALALKIEQIGRDRGW